MIRVIDLRRKPAQLCVYVGRAWAGLDAHPLANPYRLGKLDTPEARRAVLVDYRLWLDAHPRRDELLDELWADTEAGHRPLACWCGVWVPGGPDLLCHAVILAEALIKRYIPDSEI